MLNRDNYCHPAPGIKYIKESVLGPGGDSDAFYSWFEITCDCTEGSCYNNCSCIKKYGKNYEDSLLISEKLSSELCIYECSAFCSCDENCPNKIVQKGPNPYLEIRKAGNKGLGVFTLQPLKAGTFISEYAGEIISEEVANDRFKANENYKYILILKEHCSNKVLQTCFDAYSFGNISRYINHSCSPNSIVIPVRTGCLVPKAAIFTDRFIEKGEEICYSYNLGSSNMSKTKCLCDSIQCKGFLPT